jgi:hydroxyacylglutathione hydrolase
VTIKKIEMRIEQIYTGCLNQVTYYIESDGEVAIIDPLSKTKTYTDKAKKNKENIKYIFETHFNEYFFSSHVSLSELTGASSVFGPITKKSFGVVSAKDKQEFPLGSIKIKVLHTPGFNKESTSYLLVDENGKDHALFSGKTLLIENFGRQQIAVEPDYTLDGLASNLFNTLRNKIMTLADDVIIYPAHFSGSACCKKISKKSFNILGDQKRENYALRSDITREEFIKEVTYNLMQISQDVPVNVKNIKGKHEDTLTVLGKVTNVLSAKDFETLVNSDGALMLDTRSPQTFKDSFIPNSINIGIDGSFDLWVGTLVPDLKQPIVLIVDEEKVKEVLTKLYKLGYDKILGILKGGIEAWKASGKEIDVIISISPSQLAPLLSKDVNILDVRKENEYNSQHIDSNKVVLSPLASINENIINLDKNKAYHIHCGGGYRSMIYTSILKSRGFDKVTEVAGGFAAIKKTDMKLTEFVFPSTL